MPGGHPHQLRDTFAVGLLEQGVPLEEVSKLLGHESIKTTEKTLRLRPNEGPNRHYSSDAVGSASFDLEDATCPDSTPQYV